VHLVRGLLDRAELVAVKTARHDTSWSEIGTLLHITRQSAWESWHDLDEEPAASSDGPWTTSPTPTTSIQIG
jgi:hypothetical protein